MTGWHEGRLAPFDLESTGVDVFTDRIVSFAIGRVGGGEGTAMLSGLVNPGLPIPEQATAVHRITDKHVQTAPDSRTACEQIAGEIVSAQLAGIPLVGWNIVYDLSLLSAELDRHGLASLEARLNRPVGPVIDGLLLDKQVDRYRKGSRRLVDVAALYGVPIADGAAHGAEADALAATRVVYRIAQKSPALAVLSLDDLHTAQIGWAAENASSFREYLARQGKPYDDVDGQWPVRTRRQVPA